MREKTKAASCLEHYIVDFFTPSLNTFPLVSSRMSPEARILVGLIDDGVVLDRPRSRVCPSLAR